MASSAHQRIRVASLAATAAAATGLGSAVHDALGDAPLLLIGAALFVAWLASEHNDARRPDARRVRVVMTSQVLACVVLGLAVSAVVANALSGVS